MSKRAALASMGLLVVVGVVVLWLSLGGSSLAASPFASSRLSTHQFPGFTLDLPSGDVHSEDDSYPTGKLELAINGAKAIVLIQWSPGGGKVSDAALQAIARAGNRSAAATSTAVKSVDGIRTIEYSTPKGLFETSITTCGVRHVLIGTGLGDDVVELHRKIVASFQCHPDPAQELAAIALGLPLVLDLPGWYATSSRPNRTKITDGSSTLLLIETRSIPKRDDRVAMLAPIAKSTGLDMTLGPAVNDRAPMTLEQGGETMTGFAQLVSCPTATAVVIATVTDDKTTPALEAIIDHGRCLKPGEAPQNFPAAATP